MDRRALGFAAVGVLTVVSNLLPESWFADGLRYLAAAYIAIDLIHRGISGYRRRRPYWTADSWRRYRWAVSVPVVALLIMLGMMVALENSWPIVGEARSALRGVWAVGMIVFMLIGVIGLVSAIDWLHRDEPSRQFRVPEWLTWRREVQ